MDNSGDLMQKKLRMASNVAGYKEVLDEANVLRQDNFLTQENFRSFEQGQFGTTKEELKRAAIFRSQLKEAMMWDEANANALGSEEAYKDILEEAKAENAKLKEDANRTGASKVFHDITGSKRKRAKDKLKRMETAKDRLRETNAIKDLYDEKRQDFEDMKAETQAAAQAMINKAKDYLNQNEPGVNADNLNLRQASDICYKYEKKNITEDMDAEAKKAVIAENTELKKKYENIIGNNGKINAAVSKGGVFEQRATLYRCSEKMQRLMINSEKFVTVYAEEMTTKKVATSDIARDVGRWAKKDEETGEVKFDEMKKAYDHAANIFAVTSFGLKKEVKTGEKTETVDTVNKEEYEQSVDYCKDRLKEYRDASRTFLNAKPELKVDYADYANLVKNCESIQHLFKEGQALRNLGRDLYVSLNRYIKESTPPQDEGDKEAYENKMKALRDKHSEIKDIVADVLTYNYTFGFLVDQGVVWDKLLSENGYVPDMSIAEKRLHVIDSFDVFKEKKIKELDDSLK